jgi:macrophage erythroblast attacher
MPEVELIQEAQQVSAEIAVNNLQPVRSWAQDNSHMLDKLGSTLLFELTCCEYINFILIGQWKGAYQLLRAQLAGLTLSREQQLIVQKLTYMLVDPHSRPPRLEYYL